MKKTWFFTAFFILILLAGCRSAIMSEKIPDLSGIAPRPAPPTVLYIPGFQVQQGEKYAELAANRKAEEIALLQKAFPGSPVLFTDWDFAVPWEQCVRNAEKLTEELKKKLLALPRRKRENLIIAGHSLGGRITIRSLAFLNKHRARVRQGILLAAAIADDDPDIARAVKGSREGLINIICREDGALRLALSFISGRGTLGAYGNALPFDPARFYQLRIKPYRKDGLLDSFSNHWSVHYLEALAQLMAAKKKPENGINPDDRSVIILYGERCDPPTFQPYIFNTSKWKTIRHFKGWQLQKNRFSGNSWRILDRRDFLRAYGTKKEMTESFENIIRQINKK